VTLVLGFADHIAPPARHGVEHADGADAEDNRRGGEHVMHPGNGAHRHDEGRNRADHRPRARIDEVVVVVLRVRRSHCGLSVGCAVPFGTYSSRISKPRSRKIGNPAVTGFSSQISRYKFPWRLSPSPAASGFGAGSRTG